MMGILIVLQAGESHTRFDVVPQFIGKIDLLAILKIEDVNLGKAVKLDLSRICLIRIFQVCSDGREGETSLTVKAALRSVGESQGAFNNRQGFFQRPAHNRVCPY